MRYPRLDLSQVGHDFFRTDHQFPALSGRESKHRVCWEILGILESYIGRYSDEIKNIIEEGVFQHTSFNIYPSL